MGQEQLSFRWRGPEPRMSGNPFGSHSSAPRAPRRAAALILDELFDEDRAQRSLAPASGGSSSFSRRGKDSLGGLPRASSGRPPADCDDSRQAVMTSDAAVESMHGVPDSFPWMSCNSRDISRGQVVLQLSTLFASDHEDINPEMESFDADQNWRREAGYLPDSKGDKPKQLEEADKMLLGDTLAIAEAAGSEEPPALAALRMAALLEVYARCVLQDADALSHMHFQDSFLSSSSVFFTSRPLTVGATKRVFQLICASVSIYYFYCAYVDLLVVLMSNTLWSSPKAVQLNILGLRDPRVPPERSNPVRFGLLHDGCRLQQIANVSNGSAIVIMPNSPEQSPNGYFLNIAAGQLAANDPVMWTVCKQSADAEDWETVGATAWRGYGTLARFFPSLAYPVPESSSAREAVEVYVDMRPNWPWILTEVGTYVVAGIGWGVCCLIGMTGRQWAAVPVVGSLFGINSILQAAAALGHGSLGDQRARVEAWMYAAAASVMAVALGIDERLIVPAFFLFGAICMLTLVVRHELLYPDSSGLLGAALTSSAFISLIFTKGLVAFRQMALYSAKRLVVADKARYDAIWKTVVGNPSILPDLNELSTVVQDIALRSIQRPMQLNRLCNSAEANALSLTTFQRRNGGIYPCWLSKALGRTASQASSSKSANCFTALPSSGRWTGDNVIDIDGKESDGFFKQIDGLDQLYYQAVALHPLLIAKIQSWAHISEGCFSASSLAGAIGVCNQGEAENRCNHIQESVLPAGFVRWRDVQEQEQLVGGKVQWAKIKSVQRSIEKATRSYKKNVSRLVDICRQSIYFESISGVVACLAAIRNDPDVIVSRIKNRFEPSMDSDASAGYRNLAVNLRIVTAESCLLGVDMHICEVQLLLLHMAAIKNEEGHKKYIIFRNLRGE